MKKLIYGFVIAAFALCSASCGGGPEGIVEKGIKLAKIGKDEEGISKIDKEWTAQKKADIAAKIKEKCKPEEISQINDTLDCLTGPVERLYEAQKSNDATKIASATEAVEKCKQPTLTPDCKNALGETTAMPQGPVK